jgi:nicotinate dehydrogenase subunit B
MTPFTSIPDHIENAVDEHGSTRRDFIKRSGLFVISLAAMSTADVQGLAAGQAPGANTGAGPYPDLDFRQLDSWIALREDGTATFFVGKTDLGQGTGTAFRQIMADELDIAYDKTTCVMGTTDVTVDQGGSGGSDALQTDGWPMRRVAAEARRVLLDLASTRLGVPVAALAVADGVVSVAAEPARRVTYGQLIGGRRFNVTLTGADVNATTGTAGLKAVQDLKIVGQSA